MENKIKSTLMSNQESVFGQVIPEKLIQFQKTRKDVDGDFTFGFVSVHQNAKIITGSNWRENRNLFDK